MPVAGARIDRALRDPATAVSRARELVVVTGRPDRAVDALLELHRTGRAVSLVVVATETYAGRGSDRPDPAVLRAAAHGIPVAVVSAESSIEEALAGRLAGVVGA
jgi:phosphoglycolate phosphatase-like HAD superfamily hydrolase